MEVFHFKAFKKDKGKISSLYGRFSSVDHKPSAAIELKDSSGETYKGIIAKPNKNLSHFGGYAVSNLGNAVSISGNIRVNSKSGNLYISEIFDKKELENLTTRPVYNAVVTGTINYDDLGNEVSRTGEIPADKDLPPVNKAASVKK